MNIFKNYDKDEFYQKNCEVELDMSSFVNRYQHQSKVEFKSQKLPGLYIEVQWNIREAGATPLKHPEIFDAKPQEEGESTQFSKQMAANALPKEDFRLPWEPEKKPAGGCCTIF